MRALISASIFSNAMRRLRNVSLSFARTCFGSRPSSAANPRSGGKDNGAPGLRPHYHANYYAAFVIGPDGYNIEVVCHEPEA